ncbi:hypothetical protein Tco_1072806 [Tanacetum coccineum]
MISNANKTYITSFNGRQVETELKLEEKFRELCEEESTIIKEREDVVEELERLSGNHVAKETSHLLRHRQKRDLDKMTHLQIMVNESHLSVHEKHTFVSKMNLGTPVPGDAVAICSDGVISYKQRCQDFQYGVRISNTVSECSPLKRSSRRFGGATVSETLRRRHA